MNVMRSAVLLVAVMAIAGVARGRQGDGSGVTDTTIDLGVESAVGSLSLDGENLGFKLAFEEAKHGIRVNTVCPGMVQTPLNRSVWQAWHDQTPAAERLSYDEWSAKKIEAVVPLGRWQTPEDIAAMIVFLSSQRAEQVTGQTINVDGGFVMHW